MTKSNIESLWPEDLVGVPETTPPVTILRQQATMLGQLTQNILEGEVVSKPLSEAYVRVDRVVGVSALGDTTESTKASMQASDDSRIVHTFHIKAPALGGYRYRLFSVSHSLTTFYPLEISSFVPKQGEVAIDNFPKDEDKFRLSLRQIFSNARTKEIIRSLMVQSISDTAS